MPIETGSAEPNVTFVGGLAVEQTEELGSNLEPDDRQKAVDAVREAIRKANAEEAGESEAPAKPKKNADPFSVKDGAETPERGPDGKFLPREGAPKKPEPKSDPDEELNLDTASVKQMLKQRERVAALKKDASAAISAEKAAWEAEKASFAKQQEAMQRQAYEVQRQLNNLKQLRSDPARVVREAGFDPEQFILDLAEDGTPEGARKRELNELKAQIAEMTAWKTQQAKQAEQEAYNYHQQQAVRARTEAVKTFVQLGNDESKFPHVSNFYKGREKLLVAAGDIVSEEFRNLAGRDGSFEQILEYLEDELADSATNWYSKNSSKYGAKVSQGDGQGDRTKAKPTGSGNAGKSLNPDASGERRALKQKPLADMDQDERYEAAKQAVRVALAASADSER